MKSVTRKPYLNPKEKPKKKPHEYRRDFSRCPRCNSYTQPARTWNNTDSEFWLECSKCNTYINTYIPQTHQHKFHCDPHRVRGNFGGYGSGKTLTSRQEFYKHLFLTPNGNGLMGANVTSQYEQTIKREIENDFPGIFIIGYSVQKAWYDFNNGYRLMFRPFDDPKKLRSLNLDFALILEASETGVSTLEQLRSRLRNKAATLKTETESLDWRKLIAESNPDPGWVRTDVVQVSDEIVQTGSLVEEYAPHPTPDETISSHITSTDANVYLPDDYIKENSANKPAWWVARYLYGSFNFSDGLVYPSAARCVVPSFQPEKHWPRLVAFDYGLSDPSHFLLATVDVEEGIVYFYKEARVTDQNIDVLADVYFKQIEDIPSGGLMVPPIIDPKSGPRRGYDKQSLTGLFVEKGIYFEPGAISVDARIFRLNTYLESGRCKIMDNCSDLISEIKEYKFKPRTLEKDTVSHKPKDANNHAINCAEWIVMELPDNPKDLIKGAFNKYGRDVERKDLLPGALEAEEDIYGMLGRELWN